MSHYFFGRCAPSAHLWKWSTYQLGATQQHPVRNQHGNKCLGTKETDSLAVCLFVDCPFIYQVWKWCVNLLPPDELQCFTLPHFKQFLRKRNNLCLCEWVDVCSVLDVSSNVQWTLEQSCGWTWTDTRFKRKRLHHHIHNLVIEHLINNLYVLRCHLNSADELRTEV